jgi:hypothetical protein
LAGKREESQKLLAELLELSKQRYVSPASVAVVYAALGDKDQAFAWLDKADKRATSYWCASKWIQDSTACALTRALRNSCGV